VITKRRIIKVTTINIPISDQRLAQLRTRAERAGLTPEEFLRQGIESFLESPDEEFRKAAEYVLKKNAELFRRLA
jgi:hypothetical protein